MNDPRLSETAGKCVAEPENSIVVSAAVAWEIAIKAQLGKLVLPLPADQFVDTRIKYHGFRTLDISVSHAVRTFHLPLYHRDPFDRILVAQAQVEGLPLVTSDPLITQYGVSVIW